MPNSKNRKTRQYHFRHSRSARWWRKYEYKHTTLAIAFVVVFILALDTAVIQALLLTIREAGLFGILLTGVLFVSFFTAGPATLLLINNAPEYNPFLLSFVAGIGTLIGDWLILKFFEEKVSYELAPLAKKYGVMPMVRQMKRRRFRPIALVVGMLLIASPLPDEAGLGLLGITKTPMRRLLPLLFLLNASGILLLVLAARSVSGA
jgi:hypothetical protein